jgi:hypothetical protein
VQVNLDAHEKMNFGEAVCSPQTAPVGLVLFDDDTSSPGELGSMTSYLPPPVNTYRLAWVWGTLEFYCDEPLSREFTDAFGAGLEQIGYPVVRSPAPRGWSTQEVHLVAERIGARRIIHGIVREFRIESKWTLTDPCRMLIVLDVRVFDANGAALCERTFRQQSTHYLVAGELGAAEARQQAAKTFQGCIEQAFADARFRGALGAAQ